MNEPPVFAASLTIGLAMMLSLATLFQLFQRHIAGQPLLAYEPRRPAPWNALPALVMLAPLLITWWVALTGSREADPATEIASMIHAHATASIGAPPACVFATIAVDANTPYLLEPKAKAGALTYALWLQSLTSISMAAIAYLLLAALFGADGRDLGLPRDGRELLRDVKIGAAAWAASLAPIYGILFVLQAIVEPESGHPLVQELVTDHSLSMMLAAGLAAVVAAPIYEETVFRLLLQGWLERREMLAQPVIAHEILPPAYDDQFEREGEAPAEPGSAYQFSARQEPRPPDPEPSAAPQFTYTYAPPGWLPIIITSVLFGLAHYGHGVSPIPLILLGAVMGYLYQRTHRVTPSIVCHLLFNLFTFVLLALQFAAV
ncbi:MAG TPA: CPBP family intramembrane glutamic endopeptidase [Lacipirellula sp.]